MAAAMMDEPADEQLRSSEFPSVHADIVRVVNLALK
jgi:hypothetical protein